MIVTASDARSTRGDAKHSIMKPVWKRDLFSVPVVKSRNDHASELTIFAPKLHVEDAVLAVEQDRVLKPGTRFAFHLYQGVAGQQELVGCPVAERLNSH